MEREALGKLKSPGAGESGGSRRPRNCRVPGPAPPLLECYSYRNRLGKIGGSKVLNSLGMFSSPVPTTVKDCPLPCTPPSICRVYFCATWTEGNVLRTFEMRRQQPAQTTRAKQALATEPPPHPLGWGRGWIYTPLISTLGNSSRLAWSTQPGLHPFLKTSF